MRRRTAWTGLAGVAVLALAAGSTFGQPALADGSAQPAPSVRPAAPGFGTPSAADPDTRVYVPNDLTDVDALTPNDAWAVGNTTEPDDWSMLLEHWDGTRWQTYPGPALGEGVYLNAVDMISHDDVWAVGDEFIDQGREIHNITLHWDGATWSAVPSPQFKNPSTLASVSGTGPDDVWAVGSYTPSTGEVPSRTLALHWDGHSWRQVATKSPGGTMSSFFYGVTAVAPDDVWAVGSYYFIQFGRDHTLAEHWDGHSWTRARMGNPGNTVDDTLLAASSDGPDDVWAVGSHDTKPLGASKPLVEHWDGARWTHVLIQHSGKYLEWFYAVSAVDEQNIWNVGQKSYQPGPGYHALTVRWDGTRWIKYQSRSPGHGHGTSVLGVGMASGSAGFAVGYYENGTSRKPFIEQWTGERWIRDRLG